MVSHFTAPAPGSLHTTSIVHHKQGIQQSAEQIKWMEEDNPELNLIGIVLALFSVQQWTG